MHLILVALSTLCNCLQVSTNVSYCMNTICDTVIRCFVTSTHPLVHLYAIVIIAYLERKLTKEEHDSYCKLKSNDIKTMLDLLAQSSTLYLSITSLLKALQVLLSVDQDNITQFLSEGLLTVLSDILVSSDCPIMNEVLMTVWLIATNHTSVISIKTNSKFIKSLNNLKDSDDYNVSLILSCLLWDIGESKGDNVAV